MPGANRATFLRLPRREFLRRLPSWLRDRLDLHHTRINEVVAQVARMAQPGERLLDAGSGEGQYRSFFPHLVYTGIDLAVGDAAWDYSNLDVIGNLLQMPFRDETFDLALCLEVLEHIPEPQELIRELARVLRPGGKVYFSTPMSWHQHQKPHDYFRYTSFGLRYLLEQGGFEVLELRPTGGYFWFLSIQFQMLSLWVFPSRQSPALRTILLPIKILVQAIFFFILPLICYYLDRLDRQKDQTMAWTGVAQRRKMSSSGAGDAAGSFAVS